MTENIRTVPVENEKWHTM